MSSVDVKSVIYEDNILKELYDTQTIIQETGAMNQYISILCPFCEGNDKGRDHGHMGIFKFIPVFKCVKCNAKGRVDKLFEKLFNRPILLTDIIKEEYKDIISYKSGVKISKDAFVRNFGDRAIVRGFNEESNPMKIGYLNNRLNNHDNLPTYVNTLVMDEKSFIQEKLKEYYLNRYDNYIPDEAFLEKMYNDYVFFISDRGSFIHGRAIDDNNPKRYRTFSFNRTLDYITLKNPFKQSNINHTFLSTGIVNVCVGEGIFDMLNVIEAKTVGINFKDIIDIFTFSMGKDIRNVLLYLNIFYSVFKINLHVLLDNTEDVKLKYYKNLKRYNSFIINEMYVYKIKNKKDFGEYYVGDQFDQFKI